MGTSQPYSIDQIFEEVDRRKHAIGQTLCDLIGFDTSNPPGRNYPELCAYIRSFLAPLGWSFEEILVEQSKLEGLPFLLEGDRVNLVAKGPFKRPPVSLYAHLDVVPAQAQEGWSSPPFRGVIVDDCVFGRGAVDMKGAMACVLFVAHLLGKLGIEPRYNPVGLFCTDEEIGGYPGVYEVALQGKIQGPLLWLEGGGQWPVLLTSLLGSMEVHLTFLGKGAHVALPFLGDNALEKAIPALASLLEYKRSLSSRLTDEPLLFFPDKRMGSTMNITMIQSGLKANIIPDTCSVVIDRRFTQEESFEGIREEMESLLAGFENVRLEAHHFYDPVQVAWDTPWHQKKIDALSKIYGLSSTMFKKGGMGGASDMSYIQKACPDVPIVGMGVMSPRSKGAHAADEAVHLDDLAGLAKEILYMLLV